MGLLSGLLGNASEVDLADIESDLERMIAPGETVERAFQLIRDLMIFTRTRLILVDKQGITAKKTEFHSIPYRAITHYSIETAGHFDLESELKIWITSYPDPLTRTFKRGDSIFEVQKALATYVK
ncbi:MAG TPA: PH domain-containing protein [Thermoanaerobaculia bacterium]|nr:PH domain-containing protein [Thermoanaerobaculia bacterium]